MFLALGAGSLLSGCQTNGPGKSRGPDPGARVREAIYNRAEISFPNARLFRPADATEEGLLLSLAPLLLFEVVNARDPDSVRAAQPGMVFPGLYNPKELAEMPVVHAFVDEAFLSGQPRPRLNYFWLQLHQAEGEQSAYTTQGIRLTLGGNGAPAIWEVVKDSSGGRLVFVSASLEAAARAAHGPPVAGRRASIERNVEEAPNLVVARVLDDGPTPMGPIVYVRPATTDIVTIICRCMKSQAQQVMRTDEYRLLALDIRRGSEARAIAALGRGLVSLPVDDLERRLRLPAAF